MKDKKEVTITNIFQKMFWIILVVIQTSRGKGSKVSKGSEFCNKSVKSWLQDNDIEIHSAHNERKSVVVETVIRILKSKICKYIT